MNGLEQWDQRVSGLVERIRENSLARKRATTQCNTAKLTQPWRNMAASSIDTRTAREQVVNRT